jgi:hypothetical protein
LHFIAHSRREQRAGTESGTLRNCITAHSTFPSDISLPVEGRRSDARAFANASASDFSETISARARAHARRNVRFRNKKKDPVTVTAALSPRGTHGIPYP